MKRNFQSPRDIEYSMSRLATKSRTARGARRGGFTLIELLVVIAIAAILSSVLLAGIVNLGASNKRTSCQVNLQQIYGALKMYATDNDGAYPYYNASSISNGGVPQATVAGNQILKQNEMGLWALYTTQGAGDTVSPLTHDDNFAATISTSSNGQPKPVGVYLRNSGNLHCPADIANAELYNDTRTAFNPGYLSYQVIDDAKGVFPASTVSVATYQSQRVADANNPNWKRQLMFWNGTDRIFDQRAASNTVITWCKWHRTGLGGHNSDPILFADGSVRSKPLIETAPASGQPIPGWQRAND